MKGPGALAGAIALVFIGATSCGDQSGQVFVVQNQVPAADSCLIPGQKTGVYQGEGTLDVALVGDTTATAYYLFPLLQNNLPRGAKTLRMHGATDVQP